MRNLKRLRIFRKIPRTVKLNKLDSSRYAIVRAVENIFYKIRKIMHTFSNHE